MKQLKYKYFLSLLLGMSIFILSCKKQHEDKPIQPGEVLVNVKAVMSNYTEGGIIETKAAVNNNKEEIIGQTIDLNDELTLTTSIIPVNNSINTGVNASITEKKDNRAATSSLSANIWYRVVVYNKDNGNFITQLDYQHNVPNTNKLILDGGVKYVIAAYSLNSTSETSLNNVFNNASNLDLAIFNVNDHVDFLFHYDEILINGNNPTMDYNITFKHMTNQIEILVDATNTEYPVKSVVAKLTTEVVPNQVINLNTGLTNPRATNNIFNEIPLNFSNIGLIDQSKATTYFNSNKLNGLMLSKLEIGEITINWNSALHLFKDSILLSAGTKYRLLLKIEPTDRYLTHHGLPAASIGGQIWLRHNVGADNTLTADDGSASVEGHYFQFGYKTPAFNKGSSPSNPSTTNWSNNIGNRTYTSWNSSGQDNNPIKVTANDPCPDNFRIPTKAEFETLIQNTNRRFVSYNTSGARAQFYSKKKKSIQLTFPAQGTYRAEENPIGFLENIHYQILCMYWTSNRLSTDSHKTYALKFYGDAATNIPVVEPALWKPTQPRTPTEVSPLAAIPIRCIAQ